MATKPKTKTIKPKKVSQHPMYDTIQRLYRKNAPVLLFEAILFVIASLFVFIRPLQTLTTLTIVLGVVLAVFGIYQVCIGLFGKKNEMSGRTLNLILGVINIILGALFFLNPQSSMMTVVFIFAIFFMVRAVMSLIFAIGMWRQKIGNYGLNLLFSVVAILLAILMLFNPAFGAFTIMYFIAFTLLFYGIADVSMYIELLRLKKTVS